nr:AAA family ATPase [Rhizobium etli]
MDRAVIDEVQRAPELLLAIKESVDTDQRPGRFPLTGSANLMMLPRVADSSFDCFRLPKAKSDRRRVTSFSMPFETKSKPATLSSGTP